MTKLEELKNQMVINLYPQIAKIMIKKNNKITILIQRAPLKDMNKCLWMK